MIYQAIKQAGSWVVDKSAVVGTGLMTLGGMAHAAIPTEVATAIETAGTDSAAVAALVFVAIVGIFAIKLMKRGL